MNLGLILNGYRDSAVWTHRCRSIGSGNKET